MTHEQAERAYILATDIARLQVACEAIRSAIGIDGHESVFRALDDAYEAWRMWVDEQCGRSEHNG